MVIVTTRWLALWAFCAAVAGGVPATGEEKADEPGTDRGTAEKTVAVKVPMLRVEGRGWGDADVADIGKVLESVTRELAACYPERKWDRMTIVVRHSREGPITLFEKGPRGEIQVRLNVRGRYWAQFAFQFAHELGHIACRYDRDEDPNEWFEESVCEATSLHVMRRMAETWKTEPPYPNWKGYAKSLRSYADDRLKAFDLGEGETLAGWFRRHEVELRKNHNLRKLNGVVAVQLLALLEKAPEHWPAFAHLNGHTSSATDSFADFLRGWRSRAGEKHHVFVDRIAAIFGVGL